MGGWAKAAHTHTHRHTRARENRPESKTPARVKMGQIQTNRWTNSGKLLFLVFALPKLRKESKHLQNNCERHRNHTNEGRNIEKRSHAGPEGSTLLVYLVPFLPVSSEFAAIKRDVAVELVLIQQAQ